MVALAWLIMDECLKLYNLSALQTNLLSSQFLCNKQAEMNSLSHSDIASGFRITTFTHLWVCVFRYFHYCTLKHTA